MAKRLTVKEHCERVRFDPNSVEKFLPGNGFKLIYPSSSKNSDLYIKI